MKNEYVICRFLEFLVKKAALYAGLQTCTGEYIAVMDADLQESIQSCSWMLSLLRKKTYDCVGTKRLRENGEPPFRSFFAKHL